MLIHEFQDRLPLWAVYLSAVLLALLAAELGYQLGKLRLRRQQETPEGTLGAMVGTTFGLLAFMLALLMSIGLARFDNRRALIVEEGNAVGTLYLRAGYLDEPDRGEVRDLLRKYVDARLMAADTSQREAQLARSSEIQIEVWERAEALARANPESEMVGLFISALNDVIDLQASRIASINARIPETIWSSIYLVGFLAFLLLGFHNAYHGRRNLVALVVLALIFATLLLLITDLDRPLAGFLRASEQPLVDLQNFMAGYP